ncbi:MAG: DUF2341 domain-containing protein [Candidatus Bathyarchaeota archaeon]|nr:DUF2341 domain-containing protein [Candidatus Bathyarchaeota archaeon]
MYRKISKLICIGILSVILLSSLSAFNLGLNFPEVKADSSGSIGWFYSGWQYRKAHNITQGEISSTPRFYDVSEPWITISGNPTGRHVFQPVHNTTIVAVDKIVDGALQKYLAYDSDPDGTEIRLYYTNDTAGYWVPYSGNPILGPDAFHYRWPSVAYVNGTFHMFLTDRTDLTLERWISTDGIHYTFRENVKVGGNQWKNPFIWNSPIDSRWYLYSHDASGSTEQFKVRNSTTIEGLSSATDSIVVSKTIPFGSPTVMFYNGTYWLLGEEFENGLWKTTAFFSVTSPSSGFVECTNSPILSSDVACPMLFLNSDKTEAYLFTTENSLAWYQRTREVYLNRTGFSGTSELFNYQIRFVAHYGNGTDNGENVYLNGRSEANFGDIRFTWFNNSLNSEVECPYWIEQLSPNDSATLWLKVPEIPSVGNSLIYIYYGKNDAATTSNGNATFEFFDDFSGNLSKWTPVGGTWQIQNGELDSQTNAFGQRLRANNFNFGNNSVHVKVKWISGTYFEHGPYVRGQPSNEQNNGYAAFISTWAYDNRHRISKMSGGTETTISGQGTTNPSQNIWYSFVFKLYGTTLKSSVSPLYPTEISGTDNTFIDGTLSLFSWSASSEHARYDDLFVTKYVNPEPVHADWGIEESHSSEYVVIDNAFVSDRRTDVGSVQNVGFHAKWSNNGSDIIGGRIYVNNTEYVTNTTGWIDLSTTSSVITRKTWVVTGVNCSGVTLYTQTAPTPSIVWDQIKITDGGITKNPITLGETTTIWFKAKYEYDNATFDGTHGILYLNTLPMSWSTINNRWEYYYKANITGGVTFSVSNVLDISYNLTAMNDSVGPQFVDVLSLPFSVISNSTISELAFNSASKILSFTVTGTSGTTGFTNVTMSKTLLSDIGTLKVYLDGNEINYSTTSTEYYWIIQITYPHSAHKVTVILDSSQPTTTTLDTSKTITPSTMPPSTSESTAPDTVLPDTPQPAPPNNSPPDSSQPIQPDPATFNLLTSMVVTIMAALLTVPVLRRITPRLRGEKKTLMKNMVEKKTISSQVPHI